MTTPARLVSFHDLGCQSLPREGLAASLLRHGIILTDDLASRVPGPTVVVFERLTDEVRSRIAEISSGGAECLIALVPESQSLCCAEVWDLLVAGAADVLAWNSLERPAEMIAARLRRWFDVDEILFSAAVQEMSGGASAAWRSVLRQAIEVASFSTSSVLITGETGTGKELIARLIHRLDARPSKREFVVLDCTTIVPELSGSEFFGHERGAFTGAASGRDGAFALADQGSLFLDEIGELPLKLQAELLRVIQEHSYKRVGSHDWQSTSFRLICATHRDLRAGVAQGTFREDLYFRLATCTIHLPPLRQRSDDIPLLVHHFLEQIFRGQPVPELDAVVCSHLMGRDYPGNVRELRQLVCQIADRHCGPGPITVGAIPRDDIARQAAHARSWPDAAFDLAVRAALAVGRGLNEIRNAAADAAYRIVLVEEHEDTARCAHRLKVSQRAIQQHLQGRVLPHNGQPHLPR